LVQGSDSIEIKQVLHTHLLNYSITPKMVVIRVKY